ETLAGILEGRANGAAAAVDMGVPRFDWDAIPLAYAMDTLSMPVGWEDLSAPAAVNVGNPHIVFFVDEADAVDLARLGPEIETDPLFPERVNVGVAEVTAADALTLRVWERGAGLTQACGTGACAAAVAAARRRLTGRQVRVTLPGGPLDIDWRADDHILMSGPAEIAFTGEIAL
ncbi:MAG: diaminopimelate epimerase, partial [Pseudomonadota bacterium]